MSKEKLANLLKSRQYVRQKITKLYDKVLREYEIVSHDNRLVYLARCEALQEEVKEINRQIFSGLVDDGASDEELHKSTEGEEDYEEKLILSMSRLKINTPVSNTHNDMAIANTLQKLKLPDVPLPYFKNGPNESLEKFIHSFEAIINKHNLSPYEKFIYLRTQLKDAPKVLIDFLNIQEKTMIVQRRCC